MKLFDSNGTTYTVVSTINKLQQVDSGFFDAQYIAHARMVGYPQNTMHLYEAALEKGYKIVECDLEFTKDNIPVLLHDPTINNVARNPDGSTLSETVSIEDMTYEEALRYDFGIYAGAEFAGTPLTKLETLLRFCQRNNLLIVLDCGFDSTQARYDALYDLVCKTGMRLKTLWSDGNYSYLSSIDKGLIYQFGGGWNKSMIDAAATRLGNCGLIILSTSYGGGNISDLAEIVDYGHKAGMIMKVSTINDADVAEQFWAIGTDLIITDTLVNT